MREDIQKIIDDYKVQGLKTCIFDANGTIIDEQVFGYRDTKSKTEIDDDTYFGIASISKSFTALAIQLLAERGVIDIDESVSHYLPEFERDDIKIWHLLTHSAGFYPQHRTTVLEMVEKLGLSIEKSGDLSRSTFFEQKSVEQIIRKLNEQTDFCGNPGEYLSYSNDSYGVLTEVIRRFGGYETYAEFMEQEIFKPLQLERTTVSFTTPVIDRNSATLYRQEDGHMKGDKNYYDNAFTLNGGGAIKSTVSDLRKYVQLYLQKNPSFIHSQYLDEMEFPRIAYAGQSMYGLGLSIENIGGTRWIGHGGALTGVSSQILWNHEQGVGIVVLCNTSNVPVAQIAKMLLCDVLKIEDTQETTEYDVQKADVVDIEPFVGTYKSDEGDMIRVTADDETLKLHEGDKTFDLIYCGENTFATQQIFGIRYFQFYVNKNKITGVKLGGRILPKMSDEHL